MAKFRLATVTCLSKKYLHARAEGADQLSVTVELLSTVGCCWLPAALMCVTWEVRSTLLQPGTY
jgi:hypothetical protein